MLSFFRSKSSDATVDKIINGTKDIRIDEATIDASKMETISNQNGIDSNNLLHSLGYPDEMKLRETIFGRLIFAATKLR